jgi:hypothetical protein
MDRKSELQKLIDARRDIPECVQREVFDLVAENVKLKAEVEGLTKANNNHKELCDKWYRLSVEQDTEIERLKGIIAKFDICETCGGFGEPNCRCGVENEES